MEADELLSLGVDSAVLGGKKTNTIKKKIIKFENKRSRIGECITSSCVIIWGDFIIPMMIVLLIFLGSLHTIYPYESTLQEDLNMSMGFLGGSVYSIYDIGAQNTNWFYYFFVISAVLIYLTGDDVYSNVKRVWSGVDKMSAQDMIDSCGIKDSNRIKDSYDFNTEMKGGNK